VNAELWKGIVVALLGGVLLVLVAMAVQRAVDRMRERRRWRWWQR
jgi:ABC-type Fe3+ transport system permease subunit